MLRASMRLNPTPSRFFVKVTELFDAGYYRLEKSYPYVVEAFEEIDHELKRLPFSAGERLDGFEGREMRVLVTPKTRRYPSLRVLYEIEDPRVVCWHVSERD